MQRHREAVGRHSEHTRELERLSGQIDKQELRKFYFTVFSLISLLAIVLPLASQSPQKRDWLPQDTVAILGLSPDQLTNNPLSARWRKEQPDVAQKMFAGLAGQAVRTPALDLARDASRITRALTIDRKGGQQNYTLVETRGDIAPVLRAISEDENFAKSTVSGLVVSQRPDVSVARVGPKTLAVGSLGEVDQLVQVRLGTLPDLKIDDPLFQQFQTLDPDSAVRLVARNPSDLAHLFRPIFPPELLAGTQFIALAISLGEPTKAHLLVRVNDEAGAQQLSASLEKEPARWLTLPESDFVLSNQPPKVERTKETVDLHFDVPEGAARLLLQRLANIQPATSP